MLGFKAVGGVLGRIFGSGNAIGEITGLIDKMHTSTAEEIQAKTDATVRVMESYAPFKIAQRVLAIMFCTTYLITFAIVMGMTLSRADVTTGDVIDVLNAFYIGWIVLLIIGFYFGGGMLEGGATAVIGKLNKQQGVVKND